MKRNKPYRLRVLILDLFMLLITSGAWFVVIILRELYAFTNTPKKAYR